jgi:hypothetical protein
MDLQISAALEEHRPRVELEPDWDDVLRRARAAGRRPRTPVVAAALLAVLAVLLAVTPAAGLRGKLRSFFDLSRSADPARTWTLAGSPVQLSGPLRAAARLTHVDPGTLRRVAAGGSGYRRVALIGGIGPDRRPWLAQAGPGWVSNFFPLFGALGEVDRPVWRTRTAHGWDGWQFPMYGRADGGRAVFGYVAFGGHTPGRVDWATTVGFVRSDVARLVVTTAAGARHTVPLARNGGYAYAAVRASALPRELTARDASGRLLGRERLVLRPLTP